MRHRSFLAGFLVSSLILVSFALLLAAAPDRASLPSALREARLERLSSGALMLLDRDGNLVQPGTRPPAHAEQAAVTLDLRVRANIRLGDDPPALPSNMRAQAEPHIARAPSDADFLVAVFQEGRFADGGAVDCGYSVSRDGGLTWTRQLIPNLTPASGGTYPRATDPVAAIDLTGNIFLNTDAATNATFTTGEVVVSRSSDGGQTFAAPSVAYRPPDTTIFPDKNWMAVNTFAGTPSAGRIVVTFTEFFGKVSPIARVFSDNGGVTWSAPAFIHASNTNAQGSQPVFLPSGQLAIVYWNFGSSSSPGERLEVVLSNDGGVTFGAPKLIAYATEYAEPNIRTGAFLPSAATSRTGSNLFVVYQTRDASGPRIYFTKSSDAGAHWSEPLAISDNPAGSGVFNPAIAASPDGRTLTATFYDHRANPGSTTLVDQYLAQSFDSGETWQPNLRLTSVSSDAALAPLTTNDDGTPGGYMLGDYLGLAAPIGSSVPAVPVWIDTRTGNSDPLVTRVGIAPQVDFVSWEAARLSLGQINDPARGGQSGDADGDGEDNLSEYKSLTDPNDPASVVHTGRSLNLSTRLRVGTGEAVPIAGFIITGADAKPVFVRALGPSLSGAGVANTLPDPTLELHDGNGELIALNDDWKTTQRGDIEATGIPPTDDREAALVRTLAPGSYTAVVRGKQEATGVALAEIYDLAPDGNSQLGNLSTRGMVGTNEDVVIGGFIVGHGNGVNGAGGAEIVVRGLGPSLALRGVSAPLTDPMIELHNADGALLAANDDWKTTQPAELQAANLAPTDDREAALLTDVPAGNYTAILRGKNESTGIGLVEVYNVR